MAFRSPATARYDTMTAGNCDPYLTPGEVLKHFRNLISARTLANWRGLGTGPEYIKVGGRVLYRQSAIEAWERRQTRVSTSRRSQSPSGADAQPAQ